MIDATQPRTARGATLTAATLAAAALFALLAFAPIASAAPDPVASGSTTVTLKQGFVKSLKNQGVTIQKISPAKLKGAKATFTVTGGTLDPLTGLGTVNLGGGLKFKAGPKSAPVKGLVVDTSKKSLTAKVAGKKMKLATIAGYTYVRNGFGVNLTMKKLKLTGSAASQLNKKLGYKTKPKPFVGNRLMGSGTAETQPSTVVVLPGGNVGFAVNPITLARLEKVGVKITLIPPSGEPVKGLFSFPIGGGTISPAGTAGVVQSAGGLVLTQKIQTGATTFLETTITLGGFYVDLSAKTTTVEVSAVSNASPELNLGSLGRSSIADLAVSGVSADPAARTVTVPSAAATLQPISAKVLNAFVEVYEGFEKQGGPPVGPEKINSGDPLGTFSFTAQTQ
jgi:hypothetical protein